MDYASRIARIAKRLEAEGPDALIVTNMINLRYLTGFTGTNGYLLVWQSGARFYTDGRYSIQAAEQVTDAEVQICSSLAEVTAALSEAASGLGLKKVGYEAAEVTMVSRRGGWEPPAGLDRLQAAFGDSELVQTTRWVEALRAVKDPQEVELIATAARIADEAFGYILDRVKPGITERELALDLEFHMRQSGAEAMSFDPIVAAAERSALPHARPTDNPVQTGHFLLFDFGCIAGGYCSDMTRTVHVGPPDDRHREIYSLVSEAQAAGLETVGPGVACGEVDRVVREIIAAAGHAEHYPHGLGHGVGMEIHEDPSLKVGVTTQLEPGHVVTVEPGVYIEGWGGVRIEDLVVVTERGIHRLSTARKDLIVL
jgi:Xaa-Pro aminopeptidase